MKHEIRGTGKPIPDNLDSCLTELQKLGLLQAGEYGWEVEFVRQYKGKSTTVMRQSCEAEKAILKEDGTVDTELPIRLRH